MAAPRVFISYSYDSPEHADCILTLADRLREDGVDTWLDRYEPSPSAGFYRWMIQQIRDADFVLLVCTETYRRRLMGEEEPGKGLGAMWEGSVILSELYNSQPVNEKFIPILPPEGYENLYRRLTNQPAVLPPPLGHLRPLSPQPHVADAESIVGMGHRTGDAGARAESDSPDTGRRALLNEMARASRGRCLERWLANGLTHVQAEELFDDASLGAMGIKLYASPLRVALLTGELGAGKSLQGERFLQSAIRHALVQADAPIPIYIPARAAAGQLREVARAAASGLGDPSIHGAAIVVDGLDEAGMNEAESLLREARVLAESWPSTAIILTSRPLPIFDQADEKVDVAPLSDAEAVGLMGRVAGRELRDDYLLALPPSVRPAVRRPLFAVLVGVYLRERDVIYPRSSADLLDTLVERAIGRSALDRASAHTLLHRLAVASTERGGVPVSAAEVGTRNEVIQLLDTRLVVERDRALGFPLPLLTQWFAAQALIADVVSPNDIARDGQRLEHWRYALALLTGTAGHETVTRVLTPIAVQFPASAAEIVHEALPEQWGRQGNLHLPTAKECGQRLYAAMSAWTQGVGPLAPHIAPLRADGTVTTVAAAVATDGGLIVSWYQGQEALPNVVPLAQYYNQHTAWRDGWPELRIAHPVPQPAWAWRWTLDKLVGETKRIVEQHVLPLPDGPLRDEAIWRLALSLVGHKHSLDHDPIPITGLETMMAPYATYAHVHFNGEDVDPQLVLAILRTLRRSGTEVICSPWPRPDLPEEKQLHNYVWSPYSDAQLLARTRAVYEAALKGYEQIVATWFPKFASRLATMQQMPVRIVGNLVRGDDDNGTPPILWSHRERLPQGAMSAASIEMSDGSNEDMTKHDDARYGWEAVRIFGDTPATDLAYGWLMSDLRRVRWL